jgi:hypothetical protein
MYLYHILFTLINISGIDGQKKEYAVTVLLPTLSFLLASPKRPRPTQMGYSHSLPPFPS